MELTEDDEDFTCPGGRDKETAFIDILYEKVKIGKLQCSTFTKDEWAKINEELRSISGVTWDPNTNVVNAAEEVWNHFYTINKTQYKTFRKEGFRHYEVLGEIFYGTSATGGLHNASTEQPPTSDEERKMEDDFLNKGTYEHVETDDEGPITHRRENDTRRRRKEPNVNKSDQLSAAMTQWASSAAEKSAESSLRQQYLQTKLTKLKQKENYNQDQKNDPYSYDACIEILNNMENVSDDAYTAGLKAFKDADFRKAFVKMPEIRRGPVLNRIVMPTESSEDGSINDTSSEDEYLFPDESDQAYGDLIALNVLVRSERSFVDRMPRRISILTERMFITEKLNGHPDDCHDDFRMQKHVFMNFCDTLKEKGLLSDGKKVSKQLPNATSSKLDCSNFDWKWFHAMTFAHLDATPSPIKRICRQSLIALTISQSHAVSPLYFRHGSLSFSICCSSLPFSVPSAAASENGKVPMFVEKFQG
ncbi:hypothetical protein Dimus_012863 [Dionaea muscipula]